MLLLFFKRLNNLMLLLRDYYCFGFARHSQWKSIGKERDYLLTCMVLIMQLELLGRSSGFKLFDAERNLLLHTYITNSSTFIAYDGVSRQVDNSSCALSYLQRSKTLEMLLLLLSVLPQYVFFLNFLVFMV